MEVVINKCYGGFGISDEAFKLYLSKKGIEYEIADSGDFFEKGHLNVSKHLLWDGNITDRTDKDLIAVIRELGDKANSRFSKLRIVEIPDGTSYEIEEYDGMEWVSETHNTWS